MKTSKNETQLIFILAILSLVGFFYVKSIKTEIEKNAKIEKEISEFQNSLRPILNLALGAKAFAIYDMETKQFFYKKNGEVPMPLASLAKIMSAVVIMENTKSDQIFKISKESLSESGDNKLLLDEKWKRDDLLKFSLVESSNDAIHEMAIEIGKILDPKASKPEEAFVSKMNEKAFSLNLNSMHFKNATGLDVSPEENGAYASARDVVKLFAYAFENYPEIFSKTTELNPEISSFDKAHTAKNTNPIVSQIKGILASKTGFTGISGGNLAVIFRAENGHRMVVVVLGSTFDDRFSDVEKISSALSESTNN